MWARVRAIVLALLILGSGGARVVHAQSPAAEERQADVVLDVSSSDMVGRTALFSAAGQAVNRAADLGLDALFSRTDQRRHRDVWARLGRIWFVNLPVAALTQGAAHDSGHFARVAEFGIHTGRRRVEQWPWPIPIAVTVEEFPGPESSEQALAQGLPVLGGGEQASTLMKQRLTDQIYRRETTGYFDWMLLAYASLDYPVYGWSDLGGSIRGEAGDFRQYAQILTFLGPTPSFEAESRNVNRLRHDAWLNLADYSLWQAVARIGQYVATGQRRTRNATLSIGSLKFVPAAYATLGSLGPERGVDVRMLSSSVLTRVSVRKTSTPSQDTFWGVGTAIRSRDPRRWLPEGTVDVWQRQDKGPGFRLDAGTTHAFILGGQRLDASARLGYKTEGYLVDAPMRASVLATISVSGRF